MEQTGRYHAYPAYKPSYAVWSGDVPDHWEPIRLKHVFAEKKKRQDPSLPAGSISFGNVIYKNEDSLTKETKAAYQELSEGEFLINPLNMNYDLLSLRTALSGINVVVSTGYMILQSAEGYDKNYLRWLLQQFDVAHMKTLGAGVRQTISYADIGNSFIFEPPYNEQAQIAAFLDYETAKIDALIAKQERLIALLEEKRQAVISHAVTKGLNPTAPLRPSGIDWLGDVPAHWGVKKFSHCTSIRSGQVDPRKLPFSEYTLIAPNHIQSGTGRLINLETAAAQGADSGKYLCAKGEVIYSKIRPALAKACIAPDDRTICSADMYPIAGNEVLLNKFLFWNLLSEWFTALTVLESDRVAMPKINREKLAEVFLPVPPPHEQAEICSFIDIQIEKLDRLLSKSQAAITLLKERRTALISAAVTGKIDVRDWQVPSDISTHDISQDA